MSWEIDRYPLKPLRMRIYTLILYTKLCKISIEANSEVFEIGSLPLMIHTNDFVETHPDSPEYLQGGDRTQQLSAVNIPLLQRLYDEWELHYPLDQVEPRVIRIVDKLTFYNGLDTHEENSWEIFSKKMQGMTIQQRATDYVNRQLKGLI